MVENPLVKPEFGSFPPNSAVTLSAFPIFLFFLTLLLAIRITQIL
jgi:hypothetical protein